MPTTKKTDLPQWKSRPVPWVARWTGQVMKDQPPEIMKGRGGVVALTYNDPHETRDEHGVLWLKEGLGMEGTPEFAFVSTYRQKAAMRRKLCQVCGNQIKTADTPWLLDEVEYNEVVSQVGKGGKAVTVVAPCCLDCVPLATKVCPNLRTGSRLLNVRSYSLWGVHGETILNRRKVLAHVPYAETPRLPFTLARQQVVQLDEWDLVLEDV